MRAVNLVLIGQNSKIAHRGLGKRRDSQHAFILKICWEAVCIIICFPTGLQKYVFQTFYKIYRPLCNCVLHCTCSYPLNTKGKDCLTLSKTSSVLSLPLLYMYRSPFVWDVSRLGVNLVRTKERTANETQKCTSRRGLQLWSILIYTMPPGVENTANQHRKIFYTLRYYTQPSRSMCCSWLCLAAVFSVASWCKIVKRLVHVYARKSKWQVTYSMIYHEKALLIN